MSVNETTTSNCDLNASIYNNTITFIIVTINKQPNDALKPRPRSYTLTSINRIIVAAAVVGVAGYEGVANCSDVRYDV